VVLPWSIVAYGAALSAVVAVDQYQALWKRVVEPPGLRITNDRWRCTSRSLRPTLLMMVKPGIGHSESESERRTLLHA
jgi:hypothetical protein